MWVREVWSSVNRYEFMVDNQPKPVSPFRESRRFLFQSFWWRPFIYTVTLSIRMLNFSKRENLNQFWFNCCNLTHKCRHCWNSIPEGKAKGVDAPRVISIWILLTASPLDSHVKIIRTKGLKLLIVKQILFHYLSKCIGNTTENMGNNIQH